MFIFCFNFKLFHKAIALEKSEKIILSGRNWPNWTNWDKLGQTGTSWNKLDKLGQTGTNWDKLEQTGQTRQQMSNILRESTTFYSSYIFQAKKTIRI